MNKLCMGPWLVSCKKFFIIPNDISSNCKDFGTETLNGTRNLTLQDIQTLAHFVNEERVETLPKTTQ